VVKWVGSKEAYNIVSLNEVQKLEEPDIEYSLGDVEYKVKFGTQKCKATILFIGKLSLLFCVVLSNNSKM
jgi:hypothetical protein